MNINGKLLAAAMTGAFLASGVANAAAPSLDDVRGYLGGELSFNIPNYKSDAVSIIKDSKSAVKKKKPGINVLGGFRYQENFGAEFGYNHIFAAKGDNDNGDKVTSKVSNIYADAVFYMDVNKEVDVIGAVGVGRLKAKVSAEGASAALLEDKISKAKFGVRVGGGAQYKIDDNIAIRGMVRYQTGNKDFLKSNIALSVGATYTL